MPTEKPDAPTGVCGIISMVDQNGVKDYRLDMKLGAPVPLAWITTSSGYFRTKPEFYCNMWKKGSKI